MAIRLEDTILLARELGKQGVDVIDCSSSGNEGPLTLAVVPRVPGYHVPFAERIRHEADMPTVEAGLITEKCPGRCIRKKPGCGRPVLPSASPEALRQVPGGSGLGQRIMGLGQCDGRFYIGFHIVYGLRPPTRR